MIHLTRKCMCIFLLCPELRVMRLRKVNINKLLHLLIARLPASISNNACTTAIWIFVKTDERIRMMHMYIGCHHMKRLCHIDSHCHSKKHVCAQVILVFMNIFRTQTISICYCHINGIFESTFHRHTKLPKSSYA